MNDGIVITIKEWADENGIVLTDEQIDELALGIATAQDMRYPTGYGIDLHETPEQKEIGRLKIALNRCQRFLQSRGIECHVYEDEITYPVVRHHAGWTATTIERFV